MVHPTVPGGEVCAGLALLSGDRRLAIEIDGDRYHHNWDGELCRWDQIRNQRLMELGWDVMRFWVYQVRDDLENCVRRVQDWAASTEALRGGLIQVVPK